MPAHLDKPLWDWIEQGLCPGNRYDDERIRRLYMHLRLPLQRDAHDSVAQLDMAAEAHPGTKLDLTEALLALFGWDGGRAGGLEQMLVNANSAYSVRSDSVGLELRVVPEVKAEVQAVVDAAIGSPGDHLANAWNEAYGIHPDPVKSYSESIKAVESALAHHVSPQNAKQTLGTMVRDIRAKPTKWKFVIPGGHASGVETVVHMMLLLWDGQTSRHGGVEATRAETKEEAQAAVHLSATLVQYGIGGAFSLA